MHTAGKYTQKRLYNNSILASLKKKGERDEISFRIGR